MERYKRNNTQADSANIVSIKDDFFVPYMFYDYISKETWLKNTPIWFKENQEYYIVYILPKDFTSTIDMIQFILSEREQ